MINLKEEERYKKEYIHSTTTCKQQISVECKHNYIRRMEKENVCIYVYM